MERYLYTARRYWWIIAAVFLILAVSGSVAAYLEYTTTYESEATIWVSRSSRNLLRATDVATDQPSVPDFLTPGSEYAEVFSQLVQTQMFVRDVLARTSLDAQLRTARDPFAFANDVRKRFRVQALGTNLVRISYRAESAQVAYELVSAAVAVRDERAAKQQLTATSLTSAFYTKEYETAQQEALGAQQDLDRFNAAHSGTLSAADDFKQRQLRLASDLAQTRVNDLKTRIDHSVIGSALLQLTAGADTQVIDAPQIQPQPSGGLRPALSVLGVMMTGAVTLSGLLVVLGTLLTASVASEADLSRLGEMSLLAAIPQLDRRVANAMKTDLRGALAAAIFDGDEPQSVSGEAS